MNIAIHTQVFYTKIESVYIFSSINIAEEYLNQGYEFITLDQSHCIICDD
jgi:hypothetical protein